MWTPPPSCSCAPWNALAAGRTTSPPASGCPCARSPTAVAKLTGPRARPISPAVAEQTPGPALTALLAREAPIDPTLAEADLGWMKPTGPGLVEGVSAGSYA
ncbi:hypothetical protein [Thermocatellispora tengchongensis]|uniref:hypothetical protein n=1 Tax=Thermocatellispora tengchongensis TaxID=1073253 RepID=UPI00160CBAE3|nr:hypothetical protein [Thermocatellispora tengchongensis]